MLCSKVVQYTTFVLSCLPYLYHEVSLWSIVTLVFSFAGVPSLYSLISQGFLLVSFFVIPGQVFRKPCLIALRRLALVGINSVACKYWDGYGFEVYVVMFFTTFCDWCRPRGASHIPVLLFLVPLIVSSPFFWVEIYCLYSVVVHPS